MRITYIAKHDGSGNDEEGAITHALETLGHEVIRVRERVGHRAVSYKTDLVLFHKWFDLRALKALKCPKAFWYFDLVDFPSDPLLRGRCRGRVAWMDDVMPLVDVGFCTDGDWVARHPDNLVHLIQGADSRMMALAVGESKPHPEAPPKILFTGGARGGIKRVTFVRDMRERYGAAFHHVERGVHGRHLRSLIQSHPVVVAPDGPVTDSYWSNRVYLTLGYGGFLLHPRANGLEEHYQDCKELVYYDDRAHLHAMIDLYTANPDLCAEIAANGLARTRSEHTYTHRVASMLDTLKARGLV